MTAVPATERAAARSSSPSTFVALYRLLLRLQVTPLRIAGILATNEFSIVKRMTY